MQLLKERQLVKKLKNTCLRTKKCWLCGEKFESDNKQLGDCFHFTRKHLRLARQACDSKVKEIQSSIVPGLFS